MFDLRGGAPDGYHRVCDARIIAGHATLHPAWQWLTHCLLFATSEFVRNDDPACECTRCKKDGADEQEEE